MMKIVTRYFKTKNLITIFHQKKEPTCISTTLGFHSSHLSLQGIVMDSSLPKTTGHDLGSKQLHNEKLLITNFFAAVSGDKEHGFKMVESFGHHLASIIRPINMEHIIPTPPSISFNHGGKSVISTLPSVLTHNSATGTANLCHSSVGSVVSTPLRGNWNDLSCSVQATDGGVSNVRSANELLSVSTNTSDESVPRSATVPSPHCGKEGGQSRIINLVAEGVPVELERDRCYSFDGFCSGSSQGDPKRRCIVDTMSPIENDLSAIEKYLISEKKDLDPLSNLPLSHGELYVIAKHQWYHIYFLEQNDSHPYFCNRFCACYGFPGISRYERHISV